MKKRKIIITAILTTLLAVPAIAYTAASYTKNINVTYGLTVTLNGEPIQWIDSNGKQVDAFIYEDTAYVPLKTLAPMLGASSQYNFENNSINITDREEENAFLWGFQAAMGDMVLPEEYKKQLEAMGYVFADASRNNSDSGEYNSSSPDQLSDLYTDYYNIGSERLDEINDGTATNQSAWLDVYESMGDMLFSDTGSSKAYSFPLHLYSNDGKVYLGKCVTDEFDDDSIWYPLIGDYSSEYSDTSIWNKFSDYGGTLLTYDESAFNDRATNPPMIVDNNGAFVAYLTTNEQIDNGWTVTELRQFVENNGQ